MKPGPLREGTEVTALARQEHEEIHSAPRGVLAGAEHGRRMSIGLLRPALFVSVFLGCPAAPEARAAERTAKITLMVLGDNRVADLAALPHHYDLMIASANVGPDVLTAFRQRNPGALVFCYVNTSDINADSVKYPYYARIWNEPNPHEAFAKRVLPGRPRCNQDFVDAHDGGQSSVPGEGASEVAGEKIRP